MATRDVIIHGVGDSPVWGSPPSVPLNVTSITADASATVSFYAPASSGSSSITHYVITPYDAGSPLSSTTVAVGSLTSLDDSYGGTALQADVTGLTNDTAYTFTVVARNSDGDSDESTASGENTPMSGLVFGDDFNGPAGAAPDPEWWVYDRCGYLAQSEVQWYKQDHCVLDGSGNLKITAEHVSAGGARYPSDPSYPGTITQPWTSGACQGNTRLFTPSGSTMTFEVRQQVMTDAGSGFWPGLFWLEGQDYIDAWKTDPLQEGWDSTGKAEIDVAEWYLSFNPDTYGNVSWAGTNESTTINSSGLSTSMHTYQAIWTPGTNVVFKRDGSVTSTHTGQVPDAGAQFFLLLYLQMLSGGSTSTESCLIDYVRVYDH